jgi:hypothetical protein
MAQHILIIEDMENVRFGCMGKPTDQDEEDRMYGWEEMEGTVDPNAEKDKMAIMEDAMTSKLEKA